MRNVKTEKKKRPKWLLPVIIVGGVILFIIILVVIAGLRKPKSNLYSTLDAFVAQEKCNFRYVIDVRADEHKDDSSIDLEKYMDDSSVEKQQETTKTGSVGYEGLSDLENDFTDAVEDTTEERSQTGSLYSDRINIDWTSADGTVDVNWNYPNFEVVLTGRIESTNPLKGAVKIQMITPYTNAEFCNLVFMDDKTYVDVRTLRNWLVNAHDTNLVQLANQLPDSVGYVELSDDELTFITPYAEIGEEEFSGAANVVEQYRRFMIIEKIISGAISSGMGTTGLSADGNKCSLNLSGDDALQLLSGIKSIVAKAPSEYDTYVQFLDKNGLLTDGQKAQILREKDNFLLAVSQDWVFLNAMSKEDLSAINLNVIGKTNKYNASTGGAAIEVNLGASYTLNNIDYVVTIYGCKQDLSVSSPIKVEKPTETVIPFAKLNSEYNLHAVREYLKYYFKLTSDVNRYTQVSTFESIETGVLQDFIDLVNETNANLNGGLGSVDIYSIRSYIDRFSSMTEEESGANDVMKANYQLVADFKAMFVDMLHIDGTSVGSEDTEEPIEDTAKLNYTSDVYNVKGGTRTEDSNSQLQVISVEIENVTDVDLTLNLSKWYAMDSSGNKYPCNYLVAIKGMDSHYDTSEVVEEVTIPAGETETVKLYMVMPQSAKATLYSDTGTIGKLS